MTPAIPPSKASTPNSMTRQPISFRALTPQARRFLQQSSALLQCQTNRGMHDKQTDHERQKPQRIEIQVKALGEAREIVVFAACSANLQARL
jgi:hypothetical protein